MAKKHLENQTGTDNSFKPVKLRKNSIKKNMKLGNKTFLIIILYFISSNFSVSEEKILSSVIKYRKNQTKF